ncbi:MAG: hypothetical protein RL687_23 [Candidatus Parcubacteria bacterium]|jgi:RNA polymerase sigma-70 factor (ECF subfamily)
MEKYYPSDSELVSQYQNGNNHSFGLLYRKHFTTIFKIFYKYQINKEESKDLSQELFIKVGQLILQKKYLDDQKFPQWIGRIANNMAIDYLRKKKRDVTDLFDPTEFYFSNENDSLPTSESKEDKIIEEEIIKFVRDKVQELDSEQKQVLLLRYYANLSFKKIAVLQKVGVNTALGRMRYALANLRKKM